MAQEFSAEENLFRGIWPSQIYEKRAPGGKGITSAAFKDKEDATSTDRSLGREVGECVSFACTHLDGTIVSVKVAHCECKEVGATVIYAPSRTNKYHTVISGKEQRSRLTDAQAKRIARKATIHGRIGGKG